MAHSKFDLVQETSTSTGATTMALAGAVTRRRRFGDVLANADTCYVFIEHASAAEWQICLATWNTGHSLTLGAVLASSTGVAVTFSAGTKTISIVAPAAKSVVENNTGDVSITRDAAIGRNATVAGTLGVTGVATFSNNVAGANFVIADQSTSAAGTMGFTNSNGPSLVYYGNASAGAGILQINQSGAEVARATSSGIYAKAVGALGWQSRGYFSAPLDGAVVFTNSAGSAYGSYTGATFVQGVVPSTAWALDTSSGTVSMANGATLTLAAGGGLIVVSENTTGQQALFLIGGGVSTLVAQTGSLFANAVTAGKISVQYAGGTQYSVYNNTGSTYVVGVGGIRTRAAG